jgi:hypothetical protein
MKDSVWWIRLWKRWHYLRCLDCGTWLTRDYVMKECDQACCRDCLQRRYGEERLFIDRMGGGRTP